LLEPFKTHHLRTPQSVGIASLHPFYALHMLLREIASELPHLAENSQELRVAHFNLQNIRRALARPDFRPR
jgi:hypothetical protein